LPINKRAWEDPVLTSALSATPPRPPTAHIPRTIAENAAIAVQVESPPPIELTAKSLQPLLEEARRYTRDVPHRPLRWDGRLSDPTRSLRGLHCLRALNKLGATELYW